MSLGHLFQNNRRKLLITSLNYVGFALFAIRQLLIGVTLLDLEIQIQENFATTSRLLIAHSVGYFSGGILVGLTDGMAHPYLVLAVSTSVSGAFLGISGLTTDFTYMAAFIAIVGLAHAFFDIVSHKTIFDLWGEKSSKFLQILYLSFGIGAFLTPIMVRPFLLPFSKDMGNDWDRYQTAHKPQDVQIKWPYIGVCIASLLLGLGYAFCYLRDRTWANIQSQIPTIDSPEEERSEFPAWRAYIAVIWVALMASMCYAIEVILCSYSQAFGVKSDLHMDKKSASLVASVFWAVSIVVKVIFVGLSLVMSEKILVAWSLVIFLAGIVTLTTLSATYEICFWISSVLISAGFSPLFSVAFSTPAKYFRPTGAQTSLILLVGIAGESIHVPIVGAIMDDYPAIYVDYLSVLCTAFFVLMLGLPYLCRCLFGPKRIDELNIKPHSSRLGSLVLRNSRRNTIDSVVSTEQLQQQQ